MNKDKTTTTEREFKCDKCKKSFDAIKSLIGHCNATGHKFPDKYKTEKPKKPRIWFNPCGVFNGRRYESIYYEEIPAFLLGPDPKLHQSAYEISGRKPFEIVYKIEMESENVVIKPLSQEHVRDFPYRPYRLTKKILNRINKGTYVVDPLTLYEEIYAEYNKFLVMPPRYKHLETIQTFESYHQHKLMTTSYIYHIGPVETGKSRACELHFHLDYRPLYGIKISAANVYGYLGFHQEAVGTIIDDEFHKTTERDEDKLAVYRAGYRRGATVPKTVDAGKSGRTIRHYQVFCSKIFAGYYVPNDEAFEDRCIVIPMRQAKLKFDEVTFNDWKRFDKLKLKLLIWRLKTFAEKLPDVTMPEGISGRMKELYKPKLQIAAGLPAEEFILDLATSQLKKRQEKRRTSLEGVVCGAALHCAIGYKFSWIPFMKIWEVILEYYNVTPDQYYKASVEGESGERISKWRVGKLLKDTFGGKKEPIKDKDGKLKKSYKFEFKPLLELAQSFCIVPEGITEVTEVTETLGLVYSVVVDKDNQEQQQLIDTGEDSNSVTSVTDGKPTKSLDSVFDNPEIKARPSPHPLECKEGE
jgi:hypothetical protein